MEIIICKKTGNFYFKYKNKKYSVLADEMGDKFIIVSGKKKYLEPLFRDFYKNIGICNVIHQTSPAELSRIRRELTGKAYRQEHSTRDKEKLLKQIEHIEAIIKELGYKIEVRK